MKTEIKTNEVSKNCSLEVCAIEGGFSIVEMRISDHIFYAVYVVSDDIEECGFEIVSQSREEAELFLRSAIDGELSPSHLFEAVTDFRRERELLNF